jgi:LAO/AO transport system kinase
MHKVTVPDPLQAEIRRLQAGIESGSRACLAQAITLVESSRADHRLAAEELVERILPRTGSSLRLGVTGIPGAGKSTMIEGMGMDLLKRGHRVAVLAIDPSSVRTGGSILGDKTRMQDLSMHPQAFVRPSPTSGALGGVARRTRECILLCEAFGFDIVIVETVGVGQSEVSVSQLVDIFLLLVIAGAGDELQGIKRGILEVADIIAVNKADGPNITSAKRTATELRSALRILNQSFLAQQDRLNPVPEVYALSALSQADRSPLLAEIERLYNSARASGSLTKKRTAQKQKWLWDELHDMAMRRITQHAQFASTLATVEEQLRTDLISVTRAVQEIIRVCTPEEVLK